MADDFADFALAAWGRLVRTAVLLGCSSHEAEDMAQVTLERCYANWSKVQRAGDPEAYVHKILVNSFRSSRRRRWRHEIPTAVLPDAATEPDDSLANRDAVVRALRALPIDQRAAVILRYYTGLNEEQMSQVLGIPAGTVKSRLSRALTALGQNSSLRTLRGKTP